MPCRGDVDLIQSSRFRRNIQFIIRPWHDHFEDDHAQHVPHGGMETSGQEGAYRVGQPHGS